MYDGGTLLAWVLALAGNIFIAILVWRMIAHYAKREWGDMITNLVAAALLAWIIWGNQSFIAFLQFLVGKITGQG